MTINNNSDNNNDNNGTTDVHLSAIRRQTCSLQ
eukprot:CAMPEP_0168263890 /NCGR_PEP_ID=MMETSP0141_2-20121125/10740_1 /TAXON_ID=44445 /ORGANISM="Pseudo-nitzschia australis, Strain 10249 10 AB" /LENGTH=32 /DNA_ID= /DNA_START= /DNA_END= /DNA_ORIENTATION=